MQPPCQIRQMLLWILHWGARPLIPPFFTFFSFTFSLIQCFTALLPQKSWVLLFLIDLYFPLFWSLFKGLLPNCHRILSFVATLLKSPNATSQVKWMKGKNLQNVQLSSVFFCNFASKKQSHNHLSAPWEFLHAASIQNTTTIFCLHFQPARNIILKEVPFCLSWL